MCFARFDTDTPSLLLQETGPLMRLSIDSLRLKEKLFTEVSTKLTCGGQARFRRFRGEFVADFRLHRARVADQFPEIDAGFMTHSVQHINQIVGREIATRAAGVRAAS